VLTKLRRRLTYANVMSTIAVVVAVGTGGAYAVGTITSADVKDGSLTGRDVKNRTLTGKDLRRNSLAGPQIAESKLGRVPQARNAVMLGGRPFREFFDRCPTDMIALASVCVEKQVRPEAPYSDAAGVCDRVDRPATPGRRLPDHDQLMLAVIGYQPIQLAGEGELTRESEHNPNGGPRIVEIMVDRTGRTAQVLDNFDGRRPFRCVTTPMN
jgi:hypothetical protein